MRRIRISFRDYQEAARARGYQIDVSFPRGFVLYALGSGLVVGRFSTLRAIGKFLQTHSL